MKSLSSHIIPPSVTPPLLPQHGNNQKLLQVAAAAAAVQAATTQRAPFRYSSREPTRRRLFIGGSILWTYQKYAEQAQALNIEDVNDEENIPKNNFDGGSNPTSPKKVAAFLDVSIDGEPAGRIAVELDADNMPVGAARFASLLSGTAGVSYRRKEFVKIMPNYVQHGGLRSYGVDAELAKQTGANMIADELLSEWETQNEKLPGVKNVAGSLGIIVRDPLKPPPKLKLVAKKGKLVIDEEEVGTNPNGTEFVITTKDSPELDGSTLVVGKILNGMDVVEKISKVKTVQENTSSPYFRVAKLIGDKRAVVAERGFNRPYSKIVITNCGLLN